MRCCSGSRCSPSGSLASSPTLVRYRLDVQGSDFIIFEVNGWHNLVHIASGIAGIALSRRADSARLFALGFGAVYLVVTIWGFVDGNDVLALIPVDAADNVLHLAIAALGIGAGLASSPTPRTRREPV